MVITVVSFSLYLILLSGFAEILAAIETDNKFCNMEGGSCKLLTFLSFFLSFFSMNSSPCVTFRFSSLCSLFLPSPPIHQFISLESLYN